MDGKQIEAALAKRLTCENVAEYTVPHVERILANCGVGALIDAGQALNLRFRNYAYTKGDHGISIAWTQALAKVQAALTHPGTGKDRGR